MNPRLIAISGPREGHTFPLQGERFTVGRQAANDLQLASLEVSRYHCELRRGEDGRYSVADLESRHGVLVNNRPVREHLLVHTDLVTVGTSVLLFLLDDSVDSVPEPSADPFIAASTFAMKPAESLYLDRQRLDAALPAGARVARDLHALLRAATTLHGPASVGHLAEQLLGHIFELVPAQRVAVLLSEPTTEQWTPVAVRQRDGENSDLRPSKTVLDQVCRDKVALLCQHAEAGEETTRKVSATGARSLLCAPLLDHHDEVLGVLYSEAPEPGAFEPRHLELLGAIAGMASLAFQNAFHQRWLEGENRRLREHQLEHDMVGESAPMRRLLDLIGRVAPATTTVLICGESGTGKELAAQAIHRSSPRAGKPFVAINCASLSQTLLESELFGHEKGAFTGAVERQIGRLEVAQGGSLFLDEVGEIPLALQAKLLRVLQERHFERVGGTRSIRADVRVVAATNRDLEAAVRDGSFRDDLYYRLKVITLETPPLRRRREDIALLASHFVAVHSRSLGRRRVSISPKARRLLMAYSWPGNVRELGNAIERALVLGDTDVIRPEDLPEEVLEHADPAVVPSNFHAALAEYRKKLVFDAYRTAGGDHGAAADLLGVHVNSLHRMINRLGIKDRLAG